MKVGGSRRRKKKKEREFQGKKVKRDAEKGNKTRKKDEGK